MREEIVTYLEDLRGDEELSVTDEEIEEAASRVADLLWEITEGWKKEKGGSS